MKEEKKPDNNDNKGEDPYSMYNEFRSKGEFEKSYEILLKSPATGFMNILSSFDSSLASDKSDVYTVYDKCVWILGKNGIDLDDSINYANLNSRFSMVSEIC